MGFSRNMLLLVTGVLLAACESQGAASRPEISPPEVASAKYDSPAGVACPSRDFPAFLDAFVDSTEIQQAFTTKPLQVDSLDSNAEPEPEVVSTMVSDVTFPVIPSKEEQTSEGMLLSVERAVDDAIVTLEKPDTDYQVRYHFRIEKCWLLVRKEDKSL